MQQGILESTLRTVAAVSSNRWSGTAGAGAGVGFGTTTSFDDSLDPLGTCVVFVILSLSICLCQSVSAFVSVSVSVSLSLMCYRCCRTD